MNIKPKPCKAINKAKGFESCGKETLKRVYGLCSSCYAKWLYTTDEGKAKIEKLTLKITKPKRELEQAIKENKKNKSLSWLLINIKNTCHEYIRLRDKGKPCISCNKPWHSDFQAGHFYKAELFSSIKFNELNIHGQCQGCNIYKDGNESPYRVNLPNRIGVDKFREINYLASIDKQLNFKWDRLKLNDIREYYKQKIKDL